MAADGYLAAAAESRCRWNTRYAEGVTPWDTQTTPPEVVDFWRSRRLARHGLALDLGCGPGTNVRYLAQLGLHAVGVEIAGAPLFAAQQRWRHAPVELGRAGLVCADVCALPFAQAGACYILDVGCLHSLPQAIRPWYAAGVVANLAAGGYYHLYAFDEEGSPQPDGRGPRGMAPGEVAALFAPALCLVEEVIARPDRRPCRWYLWQKPG
jgi:SAM-dependent methyltransferase